MDLRSLYTSGPEGAALHLKHPATGEPLFTDPKPPQEKGLPVTLQVVCQDSDHFRQFAHAQTDRTLAKQQPAKPGEKAPMRSSAEIAADEDKLVAQCIIGWDNVWYDGVELPYSPPNALKLVTDLPWLREQVDRFAATRANFMKASSAKR